MAFVLLGIVFVGLKLAGLNPVGQWPWFLVLAPFVLAMVWWAWSDRIGRTSRQAMRRERARKQQRRNDAAATAPWRRLLDRVVLAKLKRAEDSDRARRERHLGKVARDTERRRQIIRDSVLSSRLESHLASDTEPATTPPRN
jgi:small Trp-rich protein